MSQAKNKAAKKNVVKKKLVKPTPKPISNKMPKALDVTHVYKDCPASLLPFASTVKCRESNEIISQGRAVEALKLGLGICRPGYNIFVAGFPGTGKTSVLYNFVEQWAKSTKAPNDWVYLYDFENPNKAKALSLPNGQAAIFAKMMEQAIKTLRKEIPAILQSEVYENSVNARFSVNNDKQARKFSELEKYAKKINFQIKSSRMGIETIPIMDGRPITEKEYNKLSEDERRKIEQSRSVLEPKVLKFARDVRALELEAKDFVNRLQREVVSELLTERLKLIVVKFKKNEKILAYLKQVQNDILENLDVFTSEETGGDDGVVDPIQTALDNKDNFFRYKVNLFLDNSKQKNAPVVTESNPSYYNLFGKIEKNVEHGMFLTDFTMIKPGALHLANGGYLILEAMDVFKMPSVWDTLKRVLKAQMGFIEDMGEHFSLFPTTGIRAEPIPLDIKVILIGTDDIYHLLYEYDHEFAKIFKIKADFDHQMPRNKVNINAYASFIATRCNKEQLLHFERSGVCAMVEYGSRICEDQDSLTTQFSAIKDLTIEADFIARQRKSKLIKREHVEAALEHKYYRLSLYEQHLMEMIAKQEIIISIDGMKIGQVNGLVVYDLGDYSFGKPSRITATIAANEDGIMNIERAVKLTGNIHDKGLFILTGFLNQFLAQKNAMGLSASICFEQSYGMIDGDSATIAELLAVVSAMAEIPIDQSFAMTGSLNQFGEVQPIGGVNEKVEGFWSTCKAVGKKKRYNVIIPHQNKNNLMLAKAARTDVRNGYLKIYPVQHFWEVFELVTGVPFGAKDPHTTKFHPRSALGIIEKKLEKINQEQQSHHPSGNLEHKN